MGPFNSLIGNFDYPKEIGGTRDCTQASFYEEE
jgi:hypothetical protein